MTIRLPTLRTGFLVTLSAVVALAVGACGGKSSHTTSSSSQTATTSTTGGGATGGTTTGGTTTGGTPLPDCVAAGIDPAQMREGTCTHDQITWVIVNEGHTLKLKTLSARLAGIGTKRVLASVGGTASAKGTFVIALVRITNRLETAQMFDSAGSQQAGLNLAGATFKEATDAERTADANSCVNKATEIRAGASETCDVIFDVPKSAAADLGKHGSGDLYVVDFGSDLSGSLVPQTIGQIRLYR